MKMTQEEFLEAYAKYKNTVYSVIFNYVKNNEDANDLQQEVFIRLLKSDTEFDSDEHMKAWLIRVASNLSKNLLRDNSRISDEPLPEEIAYSLKEDNGIFAYVLQLPEKYRIPIHLHYYEEYSTREIAQVLEIPEATVRIRLKRGRERLKKVLQKEDWL